MYKEKDIKGILTDGKRFNPTNVTVRMTKDERGATLSLTADNKIMIAVSLEDVKDIVKAVEE